MVKPLDSPASFRLFLSSSASQSCLNASFYRVYSSFRSLIPFSVPARPISSLVGLLSFKFCFFLNPSRMDLTNPSMTLGRFLPLSTYLRLSTLSGIPPFPQTYFGWPPSFALFVGLNLSFLIGALVWFSKLQKSLLSSPTRCCARICSSPCTFLSFHQ